MKNIKNASWIKSPQPIENAVFDFYRDFEAKKPVKSATLEITALGIYEAKINGERVGNFIFTSQILIEIINHFPEDFVKINLGFFPMPRIAGMVSVVA